MKSIFLVPVFSLILNSFSLAQEVEHRYSIPNISSNSLIKITWTAVARNRNIEDAPKYYVVASLIHGQRNTMRNYFTWWTPNKTFEKISVPLSPERVSINQSIFISGAELLKIVKDQKIERPSIFGFELEVALFQNFALSRDEQLGKYTVSLEKFVEGVPTGQVKNVKIKSFDEKGEADLVLELVR